MESITNEFLNSTNLSYDPNEFNEYIMILFNHLLSNKELGFILKESNLIYYVKDLFDRFFYNKSNSVKEQYNYYFISGGIYNIYYYYWLVSGCKERFEKLAECGVSLIQKTFSVNWSVYFCIIYLKNIPIKEKLSFLIVLFL